MSDVVMEPGKGPGAPRLMRWLGRSGNGRCAADDFRKSRRGRASSVAVAAVLRAPYFAEGTRRLRSFVATALATFRHLRPYKRTGSARLARAYRAQE
jgi:hypothetical protein